MSDQRFRPKRYYGSPGVRRSRQLVDRSRRILTRRRLFPISRDRTRVELPRVQPFEPSTEQADYGISSGPGSSNQPVADDMNQWYGNLMEQQYEPLTHTGMDTELDEEDYGTSSDPGPSSQPAAEDMNQWYENLMEQQYEPLTDVGMDSDSDEEDYGTSSDPGPSRVDSAPPRRRTAQELYTMNLQAFREITEKNRNKKRKDVLVEKGFKKGKDRGETRWFPPNQSSIPREPTFLMPQRRQNLQSIRRSLLRNRQHMGPKQFTRRYSGTPQWRRSRQLVNRSRDILLKRQRDRQHMFNERREQLKRNRRREWSDLRSRRVHQRSPYLIREQNISHVRDLMNERYGRALGGYRRSAISSPNMDRVVPILPRSLPAIEEEDEEEENFQPIFNPPSSSSSSSSSYSTSSSSSDSDSSSDSSSSSSEDED